MPWREQGSGFIAHHADEILAWVAARQASSIKTICIIL